MAKFTIYSPSGDALYEGTPTFSGTFMEPGQLAFRNVASPFSIGFPIGSYVDYTLPDDEDVETRTGERYKMYFAPAVTKQARQGKVGNSLVYDSIVFYDASKMLEFCPFRDYVTSDNNIHFSTQQSWSTFEDVEGIRKRIQANVDNMYPDEHWVIELATRTEVYNAYYYFIGKSAEEAEQLADEYEALVTEAREYSFSGGSVLDALKRIYEVWKDIGWRYYSSVSGSTRYNKIRLGPVGALGLPPTTMLYGKGKGLKSLKRSIANEGELCNRIYPYGNSTNVFRDWYRRQNFLAHDTADIQNLMLPLSDWGTVESGGLLVKTPLKAFLEDANSISRNGLRPKYVYFDGSDDLDDIFPTIKGLTVQDIRDYISGGGTVDYPPGILIPDSLRIDKVISVKPNVGDSSTTSFDSGVAAEDGRANIISGSVSFPSSISGQVASGQPAGEWELTVVNPQGAVAMTTTSAIEDGTFEFNLRGIRVASSNSAPQAARITAVSIAAEIRYPQNGGVKTISGIKLCSLPVSADGVVDVSGEDFGPIRQVMGDVGVGEVRVIFYYTFRFYFPTALSSGVTFGLTFTSSAADCAITKTALKNFGLTLPPFGFNLSDIAATEDKVRIKMTSGKCAGREFVVTKCEIAVLSNYLNLTLNRYYDESLSQYFPNTDYPVEANDEFVILGIAMPDFYMEANAQRLKVAAQKYLDTYSREIWQYAPEIDPKYMVEHHGRILAGQYMKIIDPDIVAEEEDGKTYLIENNNKYMLTSRDQYIVLNDGSGGVAALVVVDSISIDESGALPSWRVTLRNRKRVPKYEIVSAEIVQLGRKKGDLIIKR